MKRTLLFLCVALIFSLSSCDEIPAPPDPPRLVNDFAKIFTSAQTDSLERVLVDFDRRTSNQICFVSVKTLSGMEVDDYALKLGNKWGIGTEEHQNGVLLLIKPRGRDNDYVDVTIQVGRGLEGAIPDAYASRIIRNVMGPYLKRDQYWPAVVKACDNLMGLASGEICEPNIQGGVKQWITDIKQDIKSGFHKQISGLWRILIFAIICIPFILIVICIEKKNEKKGKSQRSNNPPEKQNINDVDTSQIEITKIRNDIKDSSDSGFGGFGGGGFGGGGASGRF